MSQNVWIMEEANIYCGSPNDIGLQTSNHLTLAELKLPTLEKAYVDHQAGGAPVAIEVDTSYNRLESTFNLAGWSPQVQKLLGLWGVGVQTFTSYGAIRDRRTGNLQRATAVMTGQLGRSNPTAYRRNELQHWEYSIRSIIAYKLDVGGDEIYRWDFFTNTFVVGGVDQNSGVNNILGLT